MVTIFIVMKAYFDFIADLQPVILTFFCLRVGRGSDVVGPLVSAAHAATT